MPRNMSVMHTTKQARNRTKTVTRRNGWRNLKKGQELNLCVKCMGLKPGEKVEKICRVRVVSVRLERLDRMSRNAAYGKREAELEGFPHLSGKEFVEMFCRLMGCKPSTIVTRIEWEYLD